MTKDYRYYLVDECIKDATEILGKRNFSTNDGYWKAVLSIASMLLQVRYNESISKGNVDKEIDSKNNELESLETEIGNKKRERSELLREIANLKSENQLKYTIGMTLYEKLESQGYIDVLGTNQGTYRIYKNGLIVKYKKGLFGLKQEWQGNWYKHPKANIDTNPIATIYYNIIKNSDEFDKNKGCGNIYV